MLNLYHALVHSNLIYRILVWGNTFPSYLTKLSKLQNKAIRIVIGKNWNERKPALSKTEYIAIGFTFKF